MSTMSVRIFIVDDDPVARMVIADEFSCEKYELHEFSDGESCLMAIDKKPDIILMDVEMPGMNGYETCRQLKEHPDTHDVDVIFISSHDTIKEKLAGYDAGGSDYLIKPVQSQELQQKVLLARSNKDIQSESIRNHKVAIETAMTAMTSAGEQGVVLDFLRRSFVIMDIEELATKIVESISKYELAHSVQLRSSDSIVNFGTKEPVPPLEQELLFRLKDGDRIISSGSRAIFNYGNVSLLIKNMPEDEDKSGRLRDHIAILMEGADSKLISLNMGGQLKLLIKDSNKALQKVEIAQKEHKILGQEIMDEMLQNLETSFFSLGLTEEQEKMLLAVVQSGVDKSLNHIDKGVLIDEEMSEILKKLSRSGS